MIEKEKQQVLSIFDEAIYKVSHKLLRIELRQMQMAGNRMRQRSIIVVSFICMVT